MVCSRHKAGVACSTELMFMKIQKFVVCANDIQNFRNKNVIALNIRTFFSFSNSCVVRRLAAHLYIYKSSAAFCLLCFIFVSLPPTPSPSPSPSPSSSLFVLFKFITFKRFFLAASRIHCSGSFTFIAYERVRRCQAEHAFLLINYTHRVWYKYKTMSRASERARAQTEQIEPQANKAPFCSKCGSNNFDGTKNLIMKSWRHCTQSKIFTQSVTWQPPNNSSWNQMINLISQSDDGGMQLWYMSTGYSIWAEYKRAHGIWWIIRLGLSKQRHSRSRWIRPKVMAFFYEEHFTGL